MPTYEYQCDQCHRTFEVRQRITAEPLTRCEACGGPLRRLLSPAPFILKGGGWYVTDYPSASRKKAQEAEKSAGKSDTKSDTKSETKTDASGEKSSTSPPKDTSSTPGSAAASSPANAPSA